MLLRGRADVSPHVVHLDHELRGAESAGDARFVADLAATWGLAFTRASRTDMENDRGGAAGGNLSARLRALRMALFRRVVSAHGLQGVILAHHADDQAETVFHRLLRGSGFAGLSGMAERATVGGLLILRPLLGVRREALREHLRSNAQAWREDASNASDKYLRNRLRRVLAGHPELTDALLDLGRACQGLNEWVRAEVPPIEATLPLEVLRALPPLVAREAARRWLVARGVPAGEILPDVVDRLVEMAADAAAPPRRHFPGGVLVRRSSGVLWVDPEPRSGGRK
jgi:tRNA(Ile)-lysidine synthase